MREIPALDEPCRAGPIDAAAPGIPGAAVRSSGPAAYRSIGTPTIEPHSVHEPS